MSDRVLLTGAFGFVGSHLARRLVAAGRRVAIVEKAGASDVAIADLRGKVEVLSFGGEPAELNAFLARVRPDVVVHLASLFIAEHTPEQVEPLLTANIRFGTLLLEAMAQAGVPALVNTGTSWEHFGDAAYDPVCLYAATKRAFQDIAVYYQQAHGMRVLTLKLFDTYGPFDRRGKLFRLLRQTAASGETLRMSAGEQLLDLVYIDDVTAAFERAIGLVADPAGPPAPGEFGVSAGRRLTLRDLVRVFGEAGGRPVRVEWGARPYRKREVMVPWSTYATLPGWAPQVGLEEGIRRIVEMEPWETFG